ncbi:Rha family transcriptional regulator [Laribacter hongkongensis]|uniref:Rha family transcriptional regulator n=1 Tax=Laribacter hongkongensis TaxID=168471 RepID=UPI001EFCAAFD|nr:Rha family transcriptional regulator [Laribacter hongkongensis]MCG9101589.1 Rha family transcriptional regulator [Laribacter hongkongensis]MCG9104285.1 Rha family transcriptional regulator [Laribacter hongkongensis]MCG9113518.1 Rha family transcriptional regulator [Laribacter hongkongensis]MCG9119256.1 Rha family transcriptional regulator [Laribacter hongkongensis]
MNELKISNLNDFVMLAGDKIVTDSRKVAEAFGKLHKNVVRDIKKLTAETGDFAKLNFELCFENSDLQNGKPQPLYRITKDGFMLLVMGFSGKKAMQIKLAFLSAFNAMADHIRQIAESDFKAYIAIAAEFQKGRDTASLCGRGLGAWRRIKPGLQHRLEYLENKIQPSLLLN